jgi:hypothetical protein
MSYSYKHALRAKGIKPIRRRAHTSKQPGDVELLPVRGVHIHQAQDNIVPFTPRERRALAALEEMA